MVKKLWIGTAIVMASFTTCFSGNKKPAPDSDKKPAIENTNGTVAEANKQEELQRVDLAPNPKLDFGRFLSNCGYSISSDIEIQKGRDIFAIGVVKNSTVVAWVYFNANDFDRSKLEHGKVVNKNKEVQTEGLVVSSSDNNRFIESLMMYDAYHKDVGDKFFSRVIQDDGISLADKNALFIAKALTTKIENKFSDKKSNLIMMGEDHGGGNSKMSAFVNEIVRLHLGEKHKISACMFEKDKKDQHMIKNPIKALNVNSPANLYLYRMKQDILAGKSSVSNDDLFLIDAPKEIGMNKNFSAESMNERDKFMMEELKNIFKGKKINATLNCGGAHLIMSRKIDKSINVIAINSGLQNLVIPPELKHLTDRNDYMLKEATQSVPHNGLGRELYSVMIQKDLALSASADFAADIYKRVRNIELDILQNTRTQTNGKGR